MNETDHYIENCTSERYIKKLLELGMTKEEAIKRGLTNHIEALEQEIKSLKLEVDYMS